MITTLWTIWISAAVVALTIELTIKSGVIN